MNKLKWWFRIVGVFYLLLTFINLPGYFNYELFASSLPYTAGENAARAFADGWGYAVFEMFGMGVFLLWASRNPLKNVSVVWLAIWLEILHGIGYSAYLIAVGFDPTLQSGFIVVSLAIIITGFLFARQTATQSS
ncbi:MAG: BphX family protein [Anaerolineales bacterium]|nr:BphX family protein [Anaerolineales bacterium]